MSTPSTPSAPKAAAPIAPLSRSIAGQYDVLIDPTAFLRTRDLRLIRSIAAPYNIGFAKEHYRIFNRNIPDQNQHFSEIYRQALEICGFTAIDTAYDIPADPAAADAVAAFLQQRQIGSYTAVNFFGAANARRFTPENIARWLAHFAEKLPQQQFVLLGYPAATPLLQQLAQAAPNCHVYEKTQTIQDNIELIRRADRVISPDTATVHIAAGLGKPLIGLYRDEGLNYWLPYTRSPAAILYYRDNINEITPDNLPSDWFE
ncbi:glycosyltransferase family 9 protein [Kingella potus]|uniref:glycosyltransferase family 9 protein n=1 Tax=Kingella potus TaxID=265175 RepID=UPI003140C3ED